MKIWIFNQYNMPPEYGHLNRHYNFGKYLKELGHEPTVFVGSYLHNTKVQMIRNHLKFSKYEYSNFPYYFIKTICYEGSRLKRIYAMFQYYRNLIKVTKKMETPNVIIGSSAHPLAAIAAIKLAKKLHCQSVVEVRDLWPESFVAYKIISKNNLFLKLLYQGEKWIYKKANKLIFTIEGGADYIVDKGWSKETGGPINLKKIFYINNGIDLKEFDKAVNKNIYKPFSEFSSNPKVVYTGSLGIANNMIKILEASNYVNQNSKLSIEFHIFGSGSEEKMIKNYCNEEGINNVIFWGSVEKKYIPSILKKADILLFSYNKSGLEKYGASLNKIFDYMAAGKPIISDCKFGYDLISKHVCGISGDFDANDMGEHIIRLISDKKLLKIYSDNARKAAEDYDFAALTKQLLEMLEKEVLL